MSEDDVSQKGTTREPAVVNTRIERLGSRLGSAVFRRAGGYLAEMQCWGVDPSRPSHREVFMILDFYATRVGLSRHTSADCIDLILSAAARESARCLDELADASGQDFVSELQQRHRQFDLLCPHPGTREDCLADAIDVVANGICRATGHGESHVGSLRNWLAGVMALLTTSGELLGQEAASDPG